MVEALADPDVAYVLLATACLAFLIEAANPGMTVPGSIGVGLLLLAGIGLLRLPTNAVGLVLIGVALVLFAIEQFGTQPWAGSLSGMLILMLGGLVLFSERPGVNRWVLLITSATAATGSVVAARTARRVRMARRGVHHPADHTGRILIVHRVNGAAKATGERRARNTRGQSKIDGEWWSVASRNELTVGQRVRVIDRRDLVLLVEPVESDPREE